MTSGRWSALSSPGRLYNYVPKLDIGRLANVGQSRTFPFLLGVHLEESRVRGEGRGGMNKFEVPLRAAR